MEEIRRLMLMAEADVLKDYSSHHDCPGSIYGQVEEVAMKTLYHNMFIHALRARGFIRRITKKEPPMPSDEELDAMCVAVYDDPEYQDWNKELDERYKESYRIPLFSPANTALFMTLDPNNSKINYFNEFYYRWKIRRACLRLLKQGYSTFIVNAGTQYGMLAMEELLEMKKSGYEYTLYRGTIFGERRSLLRNILYAAYMSALYDKPIDEVISITEYGHKSEEAGQVVG